MSKNVTFKTGRKSIEKNTKLFTVIFAVAVLVICFASVLYILKDNDFDKLAALGGDAKVTAAVEETKQPVEKTSKYYLFWCKDSSEGALRFMWVTGIKLPSGKYTVYSPSIDESVQYKGEYHTLGKIFSLYGIKGLQEAIEGMCGVKIDAYIGADEANFRQMINYLGSVTVDLDEPIHYNGEYSLILVKGENILKGDTLYKFLAYTNFMQGDTNEIRCKAFSEILENTISPKKADSTDKLYSKIANQLISDITIVSYSTDKDFIRSVFETGVQSIYITEKPSQITK